MSSRFATIGPLIAETVRNFFVAENFSVVHENLTQITVNFQKLPKKLRNYEIEFSIKT